MISHLQLQKQKEEIAGRILAKGNIPTSHEIEAEAKAFFETKVLGLPYYRPLKQIQWGLSNPTRYNQMFSELEKDLAIAYQASLKNNQSAIELEENYLIERERLDARIQALRVRLAQMSQLSSQSKHQQCYSQTFKDFFQVDFKGNDQRNIPVTNAFVDLEQRQATIDTLTTSTFKYDIADSNLSFSVSGEVTGEHGALQNITRDALNESYGCAFTHHSDGPATAVLTVQLEKPVSINHVRLDFVAKKELSGSLSLMKPDGSQDVLYISKGRFTLNWLFDLTEVQQLQLTLTTPNADGITDAGDYLYRYLLRRLTISQEVYANSATLVSHPFELNRIPSRLTVKAEESVFNQTAIEYYLGLDNGVDKINWKHFKNNEPGGFDVTDSHLRMINVSEEKNPTPYQESRHVYSVFELPTDVLPETVRITPFYQKWKIEAYPLDDDYIFKKTPIEQPEEEEEEPEEDVVEDDKTEDGMEPEEPSEEEEEPEFPQEEPTKVRRQPREEAPQFEEELVFDLLKLNFDDALEHLIAEPTVSHLDCSEYFVRLNTNTIYTFTQYVDADDAYHISEKFIQTTHAHFQYRLFVNGAETKPVEQTINLKLKKGRNKIQMVLFAPRNQTVLSYEITHNLNFKEVSTNVYGELPLTAVDYHTLCNLPKWQTKTNEFTSYAIRNRQVLVRHHPSFFLTPGQSFASTAYQISYQTIKASAKSLLTPTLEGYKCQLRFMAILKSDDAHYSPCLHHYQILSS